jgi:hypothetical protein
MAEISREPADQVDEANPRVEDDVINGVQDDVQTTQARKQPNPSGAEPRKEATGEDSQDATETSKEDEKPQPSKLKVLWGKIGLDPVTIILMLK